MKPTLRNAVSEGAANCYEYRLMQEIISHDPS